VTKSGGDWNIYSNQDRCNLIKSVIFQRISLYLFTLSVLGACGTTSSQVVQPIAGIPEGTDGFAWWNDTVFYEIFVRSFYDSNGDGIGDFNGIIEKLDYLNDGDPQTSTDLGITGIWLMPINPSASYHGYDVTDYYNVNPDYGTMQDFQRLLTECHRRGIRVIIDMVFNHTSVDHPWFQEARDNPASTRRNWYIWTETDRNYRGPWNQEVWYPSVSGYYYAIFWSGMPDLNYTNPDVTAEIDNVARFWLQDLGVDGFRVDAARYLIEEGQNQADTEATHTWWRNFRVMYKAIKPDALTVGEIWTTNYSVVGYVQGDELDMAFNFDLASAIINYIGSRDAGSLTASLRRSFDLFPPGAYATFLTNHDQERVMTAFSGDEMQARLAASVLFTGPGVPFIYYGEEIGMTGTKPDPDIRTPMQWSAEQYAGFTSSTPWGDINRNYTQVNVSAEADDPTSLLSYYRSLITLRNNHSALRVGEYFQVTTNSEPLLAFLRVSQEETILVIINLGEEAVDNFTISLNRGPLSGSYRAELLLGEGQVSDFRANDVGGFIDYQPLREIPATSTLVIQLRSH
jgi:alpha-amylase